MSAEMKVPPPDVKELFVPEDKLAERYDARCRPSVVVVDSGFIVGLEG